MLIDRVRQKPHAMKTWQNCRVLIVDEVSMLDGVFFDELEQMARVLREEPDQPFGGIQSSSWRLLPTAAVGLEQQGQNMSFYSKLPAGNVVRHTVVLNQVFRQKDQHFMRMLWLRRAQLAILRLVLQQAVGNNRPWLRRCPRHRPGDERPS